MIQITFNQNTIEYLLIILVRVSSFVFIAPFFGDSAVPARVKSFIQRINYNLIVLFNAGYQT